MNRIIFWARDGIKNLWHWSSVPVHVLLLGYYFHLFFIVHKKFIGVNKVNFLSCFELEDEDGYWLIIILTVDTEHG